MMPMSDIERGPQNKALYDLLTAYECAAVNCAIALTHKSETNLYPIYVTAPPIGGRTLADAAGMIRSCVRRIQIAESECPTQSMYEVAADAEKQAYLLWQQMKAFKGYDPNGARHAKVIHQKQIYETAKEQRIQLGGQIHGTRSIVRRMHALIAGEVTMLRQEEGNDD